MKFETQRRAQRSLACTLTITLLLLQPLPLTVAQVRETADIARPFSQTLSDQTRQSGEDSKDTPFKLLGMETAGERLSRLINEARPAERLGSPKLPPPVVPPRPQAEGLNFFNGPLQFTTMMESAARPACGCNGEPTYNQGISLIAQEKTSCQNAGAVPGIAQDTGHATVFLHNGEFFLYQVDLEIKGRGFNWKFERKYRSGINFEGPLGHNWEFNYNRRLFMADNGDVIRMDGEGRADRYTRNGATFIAPAGFYTRLNQNIDGSFVERDRNGALVFYSAPDNQHLCHMTELRDRNGNRMQFKYNDAKQLKEVIDTLGRSIAYRYNTSGHLAEVEDFTGRKITFHYNDERTTARTGPGDLIAVTSPQVVGTPKGNDFIAGKTTLFRYSSEFADEKLNHNMVEVVAANEAAASGPPRVTVEYDNDVNSPNADRVLHQLIGGVNLSGVAAGGTISYQYQPLGTAPAGDFDTAVFQTTVTDRNGNLTEYRFNQLANIVRVREFTNRHIRRGDPGFFETRYEYNQDGEMTRMVRPEGNAVENVYDEHNPLRFGQGNLLSRTTRPDSKRGGDQAFIQTTRTYEPVYNRLRTETEPRGNDPAYAPQNGGTQSAQRYTTTYLFDYQEGTNFAGLADALGVSVAEVMQVLTSNHIPMALGDVNGDGHTDQIAGNVVAVIHPTVNLLPDSNMAQLEGRPQQPIAEFFRYNQFGQITQHVDAESNIDTFEYYPENDPDGDKLNLTPGILDGPFGYLKQQTIDAAGGPTDNTALRDSRTNPKPAAIKHVYFYDRVGNVIKEVDGRDIATEYSVNELNQVVEIRRAADTPSFNYRIDIFYDANNNVIKREVENRDSNNQSLLGNSIEHRFVYDILDNLVEERQEVSKTPGEAVVTKYRYDRNENRVLVISPVANLPVGSPERQPSNVVSMIFDERDLVFTSTRGGMVNAFRVLPAYADIAEIGLIPNSADMATGERDYDGNRNLVRTVDASDNTGDGLPEATLHLYDGFDRLVSDVDAVGNQSLMRYDPAGDAISTSRFGPVGGRSAVNSVAATLDQPLRVENLRQPLLSQAELKYDEMRRLFERDDRLFDYRNQGVRYDRAPLLRDGPLGQSNDGLVVTRYEYDRNGRRTHVIEDDLDTRQTFYDGADRAISEVDPEGNEVAREYDGDSNAMTVIEREYTQRQDVAAHRAPALQETFTTINVYDRLNRLIRTTDNLGQTIRYQYDSRDNLIQRSDAQHSRDDAQLIADPLGRFPVAGQLVSKINQPGNTTDYFYDGMNRKIAEVRQLRVGGQGGGALDTSNAANPDGLIVNSCDWDANSRLIAMADDGSTPGDQNTNVGIIDSADPKGNITRYVYDDLNRRKQEIFDDGTIRDYVYDGDNNLLRVVDQNGTILTRRFDGINRLVQIDVKRATSRTPHRAGGFKDPNVRWQVTGTTLQRFEYDGLSRLTLAFDNNDPADPLDDQPVTYSYDSLSRVLEERQCEFPVSSRWAGDNNRVGLVYPNGRALDITYDHLDRIDTISDANTGATLAAAPIVDYSYIGPDRVLERVYGNGVRLTHLDGDSQHDVGYDGVKREVMRRHLDRNGALIAGFEYSYDRVNNKLSEKESRTNQTPNQPARVESYEYDSAYRLTKFDRTGDDLDTWQLDGVGNWAKRRSLANQANNMNEYTVFGRVAGATAGIPLQSGSAQFHDDNGNLLDDGTNLYEYDFANRLRKVTRKADRAAVAIYFYDAHNRRFQATVTNSRSVSGNINGTVRYFYDGWQEIEEVSVSSNLQRAGATQQYVYGLWIDEPLTLDVDGNNDGRIEPSDATGDGDSDRFDQVKDKRFFYSEDGKRYIAALTDHHGAVVERYRYDAYGIPTITDAAGTTHSQSAVNNHYLFAGRRFDPESGLYYYRHRYMNPQTGRFIHRDPIGMWSDEVNLGNAYAYVGNNPINYVDPDGRFFWVILAIAIALATVPGDSGEGVGCAHCTGRIRKQQNPYQPEQPRAQLSPNGQFVAPRLSSYSDSLAPTDNQLQGFTLPLLNSTPTSSGQDWSEPHQFFQAPPFFSFTEQDHRELVGGLFNRPFSFGGFEGSNLIINIPQQPGIVAAPDAGAPQAGSNCRAVCIRYDGDQPVWGGYVKGTQPGPAGARGACKLIGGMTLKTKDCGE
ncbi:MAG TPA: RHS repeat-associated core domain-containing protein [Blastocatellia bacterium]|nr:RHS repeat-associated core domain-containing protein [Blastocatellia bacterium]